MIKNEICQLSKLNPNDLFFFIDLDGTLIDTDMIHFEAYVYAFSKCNINLTFTMYQSIIERENKMDNYLDKYYLDIKIQIKNHKNNYLLNHKILLSSCNYFHKCCNHFQCTNQIQNQILTNNLFYDLLHILYSNILMFKINFN